jgi:hypothetical protein
MSNNFEDNYNVDTINDQLQEEVDETYFEFDAADYDIIYQQQVKQINAQFAKFEKDTELTFDEIVHKYSILVGLKGESYVHATRMIFYSLLANQVKFNSFASESKNIDLRINVLLQLKAGHGKKNYEYFIKRTITNLGKEYQEPTSYHPEQFVGKIVVDANKGDPTYTPIFGTLASDFLVIDEAHALLTRKENEECLRYLRTALDPIGDNEIQKKQVNVPDSEKLKYQPNCTVMLLTQPITNINEELLMRGSFRRFVILFINTSFEERVKARRDIEFLTLKQDVHNKIWIKWIELNKKISNYKNLQYVCPDYSVLDTYLDECGNTSLKLGKEVLEYFNTSQVTIKQNIFKMAIIRAIIEHTQENVVTIKNQHLLDAIKDWQTVWKPQIEWIAQQLIITSSNPLTWNEKTHGVIVDTLSKFPNQSCEVSTIIEEVIKMNGFPKNKSTTSKIYKLLNQLKAWGYITSKKIGGLGGKRLIILSR